MLLTNSFIYTIIKLQQFNKQNKNKNPTEVTMSNEAKQRKQKRMAEKPMTQTEWLQKVADLHERGTLDGADYISVIKVFSGYYEKSFLNAETIKILTNAGLEI